jgi:hypothetical protein
MKKLLTIAIAAFVFVGCSKKEDILPAPIVTSETDLTDDSRLKRSNDDDDNNCNEGRPFKGSIVYKYTEAFNLPCNCGTFSDAGNYFGNGVFTHLGKTTSKIKPCISMIFSGSTPIGVHVGQECGFFQSANGDILNCVTLPYDMYFVSTGGLTGYVTVNFSGGTGKFKKAKGSFKGYTTNDGMGTVTLDVIKGSIDY